MAVRKVNFKKFGPLLSGLKSCLTGYCQTSNLHGFRNISAKNKRWHERLFWIVVCATSTFMTVVMFLSVWERYQISPTMTTIETNNYPTRNVPFPAITVCNLNKILKSSFEIMAEKFEKRGIEKAEFSAFVKQLPQIYSTRTVSFGDVDKFLKVMVELGYNLESFMYDLSQSCSELLVRCLWLGNEYECWKLFDEVITPEGFCCTFNRQRRRPLQYNNTSIRKPWDQKERLFGNERKYKYVDDASTPLSGLTFVLDTDEDNFFASVNSFIGSVVIIHNSLHRPDTDSPRAFIQSRSEVMITLKPNVIESSKSVRELKIHHRQCYFDGEHVTRNNHYSYERCTLECKLTIYFEKCGCSPFYYPNYKRVRSCELPDINCLAEHRVLASQDTGTATEDWDPDAYIPCRCLPSCNDINYEFVVQGNEIRDPEYASSVFQGYLGNRSVVSVFFEQNVCIKYRIESLITWESVIASFGGIFGLYLGGSIISLIELLYYFLYDRGKSTGEASTDIRRKKSLPERKVWKIKPFTADFFNS